jgi:hypothetical protein
MQGFLVQGRGVHAPQVRFHYGYGRVIVHIDDEVNPEFWLHLDITDAFLLRMLNELIATNPDIAEPLQVELTLPELPVPE